MCSDVRINLKKMHKNNLELQTNENGQAAGTLTVNRFLKNKTNTNSISYCILIVQMNDAARRANSIHQERSTFSLFNILRIIHRARPAP